MSDGWEKKCILYTNQSGPIFTLNMTKKVNKFEIKIVSGFFFNSLDQISHNFHYFSTKILLYLIWVVYQQLQIAFRRGSATKSEDYGKKKIDNSILYLLHDLHSLFDHLKNDRRSLALLSNIRCEMRRC